MCKKVDELTLSCSTFCDNNTDFELIGRFDSKEEALEELKKYKTKIEHDNNNGYKTDMTIRSREDFISEAIKNLENDDYWIHCSVDNVEIDIRHNRGKELEPGEIINDLNTYHKDELWDKMYDKYITNK